MPSRFLTALSSLAALALALSASGCRPRDPLDWKVTARTPSLLAAWRSHVESDTGPELRGRVEQALQEIRLHANRARELAKAARQPIDVGPTAIDDAVCEQVDGRSLREFVQLGYELRLARLQRELGALQEAVDGNTRLVTKPGDDASRRYLDALRERQLTRVRQYRADIADAQSVIAPLRAATGKSLLPPAASEPPLPTDQPDEMPTRLPAVAKP